ncbi:MAG: hypothetical protein LJE67_15725 [Salaquimonas sp.]|jgi:hypothetical protein|nr:hypothetical protein [Salaquimonas sp.]
MKKVLVALAATGFIAGVAGSAIACPYHSAEVEKKLTLAQSEKPVVEDGSAMSTHDPDSLKLEDEVKTE